MPINCAAIMCIRNEATHLHRSLSEFIDQGIDVVVIDHESTDQSVEICKQFLGRGLLKIETMPWNGVFDLTQQLQYKKSIADGLDHEWIIHADADEWLQSPVEGESLLEGIQRVSSTGFNVINFEEFVFVPFPGQEVNLAFYQQEIISYYFFAPDEQRLMRAWNRSSNLQNVDSGGHTLSGDSVKIAPESFCLRHYLILSQEHAFNKYLGRVFSDQDLAKDWHGNRLNLAKQQLQLPESTELKKLTRWDSTKFDRTDAKTKHYWEWD